MKLTERHARNLLEAKTKILAAVGARCAELERERDGLSLLRDHLEEEIGKFRARCEKLEKNYIRQFDGRESAEAERDEAREWAWKYKTAYKDTEREALRALDVLTNAGKESIDEISEYAIQLQNKLKAENADLRAQLATVQEVHDTTLDIALKARAQRDSAWNYALDMAASDLNSFANMLFSPQAECFNDAADRVRSFKIE